MYVWFDALTNYLTALGFGSGDAAAEARLARFWPTVTHFVGKEIVRQHALYWPAFLMSAGMTPPRRIIAHGWWLMGGAKMSKSLGNVARYQDYTQVFGLDGLRYFVMREMPLGQDANFSDEAMLTRFNADLANDLGNLVSRATTMVHRYRDGVMPASPVDGRDALDRDLVAAIGRDDRSGQGSFGEIQVSQALQDTWGLVRHVNKYIVEREPWKLAKDAANDATARIDAVSRRRRASGHCGARRSGDAGCGGRAFADARRRQREPWTTLQAGTLAPGTRLGDRSSRCFRESKRP